MGRKKTRAKSKSKKKAKKKVENKTVRNHKVALVAGNKKFRARFKLGTLPKVKAQMRKLGVIVVDRAEADIIVVPDRLNLSGFKRSKKRVMRYRDYLEALTIGKLPEAKAKSAKSKAKAGSTSDSGAQAETKAEGTTDGSIKSLLIEKLAEMQAAGLKLHFYVRTMSTFQRLVKTLTLHLDKLVAEGVRAAPAMHGPARTVDQVAKLLDTVDRTEAQGLAATQTLLQLIKARQAAYEQAIARAVRAVRRDFNAGACDSKVICGPGGAFPLPFILNTLIIAYCGPPTVPKTAADYQGLFKLYKPLRAIYEANFGRVPESFQPKLERICYQVRFMGTKVMEMLAAAVGSDLAWADIPRTLNWSVYDWNELWHPNSPNRPKLIATLRNTAQGSRSLQSVQSMVIGLADDPDERPEDQAMEHRQDDMPPQAGGAGYPFAHKQGSGARGGRPGGGELARPPVRKRRAQGRDQPGAVPMGMPVLERAPEPQTEPLADYRPAIAW